MIPQGGSATFWVHADHDGHATVDFDHRSGGQATVRLNGHTVDGLTICTATGTDTAQLFLSAGINQLTVTGTAGNVRLDRVRTGPATTAPPVKVEAETGQVTGAAEFSGDFPFAPRAGLDERR
ncbi:hypothetical protein [Saccharothrix xinjiangensis]|uniref:Uncharacterized protein n=1 Tax=Saccharothrix xinjiangensis TaxID=204798 RepID=A0ABV9Y3X7_9PSEU